MKKPHSAAVFPVLVVLSIAVSAKSLDPAVDPVNEYEVSLQEADSLSRYFYSVLQVYNEHMTACHDLVGCQTSSTVYPNMPAEFYERNADNMHWIELDWDLDGLHSNMYRLQSSFNRHVIDNHPGLDTLIDAVYDLGFPDVEMTQREYTMRMINQLEVMIDKLKDAIEVHIEYHIDPTILDEEPAEPDLPEYVPPAEPRYDPPETMPENTEESSTGTRESEPPATDSERSMH